MADTRANSVRKRPIYLLSWHEPLFLIRCYTKQILTQEQKSEHKVALRSSEPSVICIALLSVTSSDLRVRSPEQDTVRVVGSGLLRRTGA